MLLFIICNHLDKLKVHDDEDEDNVIYWIICFSLTYTFNTITKPKLRGLKADDDDDEGEGESMSDDEGGGGGDDDEDEP